MGTKLRKTYRFALFTSLYITFILAILIFIFELIFFNVNWSSILFFGIACFLVSFFLIQIRVEIFIYRRVKSIYDSVSLLDSASLSKSKITTDITSLKLEVEKFAKDKKLEIETLQVRENYRKEFMGNISHELKTPLFTVQGYILTLLDGAIKDKKVRKKYLNRASKGVDRLLYIVKDLDMITKLETGDLNLHQDDFDLIEMIENVFELLEMKAAKKEISVKLDKNYQRPVLVHGDQERVQQVLTNLIVNSIKYGRKKGNTTISIEDINKDHLVIKVIDDGIGIEKEHIPRLFERFFRVDKSGSRKEGGSGLGLSIVKHIIEAHEENLAVESEFGKGSTFSFTLKKANQYKKLSIKN
ncbi:sensor histidine kinase [Psychroflexus salis]|uniref:histidine kinase n=1 Tax=Psychroflexus salis TaxID=1526574 RepID=A0A916ZUV9_9FLAO|nr:ATP-binding protein [Psychroflexus salis]GGE14388.1 two-component sensor histidine kinase [Psychroflexus salis]